jgi:hypothetical protein
VIYAGRATGPTRVTITLVGDFDTHLGVLSDCADDNTCLGEADAFTVGTPEVVNVAVADGGIVFANVGYWSNSTVQDGTYTLTIEAAVCTPDCAGKTCGDGACGGVCGTCVDPAICDGTQNCVDPVPGDACTLPIGLDTFPAAVVGDTTLFTNPSAACGNGGAANDVIYSMTAVGNTTFTITLVGDFDSHLGVLSDCTDNNACVGEADVGTGGDEVVVASVLDGETIFAVVDYWSTTGTTTGSYSLSVTACNPDRTGKVCGGDGCGGTCGACDIGLACDPLGQCVGPESIPGNTCAIPIPLALDIPFDGNTTGKTNDFNSNSGTCSSYGGGGSDMGRPARHLPRRADVNVGLVSVPAEHLRRGHRGLPGGGR